MKMDVEEYKKLARNKIEAEAFTKHVRDKIKTTIWEKQNMRGFKRRLSHLLNLKIVLKSVDEQQDATIAQL